MLDPKTILFDKYNVWRSVWYIPTERELYIIDYDGYIIAKYCVIRKKNEWPSWGIECAASTLPPENKPAFDTIVRVWSMLVLDGLVNTLFHNEEQD